MSGGSSPERSSAAARFLPRLRISVAVSGLRQSAASGAASALTSSKNEASASATACCSSVRIRHFFGSWYQRKSCSSRRENTAGRSSPSKLVNHSTAARVGLTAARRSRAESRATIAPTTVRSTISCTPKVSHEAAAGSRAPLCEDRRMLLSFLYLAFAAVLRLWRSPARSVRPGSRTARIAPRARGAPPATVAPAGCGRPIVPFSQR